MIKRNVKIEVWVDAYYARFIGIWYPEEELTPTPMGEDVRPDNERNLPKMVALTTIYQGRREVVGDNPIVPSQHPMPATFLQEQVRAISHMFANDIGVFQPSSKGQYSVLLSRLAVGFTKVKEMRVSITPPSASMTLLELKNSLSSFTDEQLHKIKVATTNENPLDVNKRGLIDCYHSIASEPFQQYITVSKLWNVYNVEDPYIHNSNLPSLDEAIVNIGPSNGSPIAEAALNQTKNAIAKNDVALEMLKTIDRMVDEAGVKDIIPELTREQVQEEMIKHLKDKLGA